jgi:hypothetical protein
MSQPIIEKIEDKVIHKTVIDVTTLTRCESWLSDLEYITLMICLFVYLSFTDHEKVITALSNYVPVPDLGLIIIIVCLAWMIDKRLHITILFLAFQLVLFLLTYLIPIPYETKLISPSFRDSMISTESWFQNAPYFIGIFAILGTLLIVIWKTSYKTESSFPKFTDFYLPLISPNKKDYRNWWNWHSWLFIIVGCFLASIFCFAVFTMFSGSKDYKFLTHNIVLRFLFWAIPVSGLAALRWAKPSVEELLKLDSRPPILVLRSYANESSFDTSQEVFIEKTKFETELANIFSIFGPSISLANPKNPIPYIGVAVEAVSDELWKESFFSYLDKASLVVVMVGKTPGFLWELEQLLKRDELYRTILISPPGANQDTKAIWDFILDKFKGNACFDELTNLELEKIKLIRWSKKGDILAFQSKQRIVESSHIIALRQSIKLCRN